MSSTLDPTAANLPTEPVSEASFRRLAWRMLLAAMFCYLFFYTGRQAFGFAIPGIQQDLGWTKATVGTISGIALWSYAIGQMVNGNLADKFGGRRLMALGALLSTTLCIIASFMNSAAGRIALVGSVSPAPEISFEPSAFVKNLTTVVGSHNYRVDDLVEAVAFLERTSAQPLFADLIPAPYPLSDIVRAVAVAGARSAPRIALRFP